MSKPVLHIADVLRWADAHYDRTGEWPETKSGELFDAPNEKWVNIDQALRKGLRGFVGGSSLAQLLAKHRNKRNRKRLPRYTYRKILCWADAFYKDTGSWPMHTSGPIASDLGETWMAVDMALRNGRRGMPGPQLIAERRGVSNATNCPKLTVKKILGWIDDHHRQTGQWPNSNSGQVRASPRDTWQAIDQALKHSVRGLRVRTSLAKLLKRHRRVGRHVRMPVLTVEYILNFADKHHRRTGSWPNVNSGSINGANGESWARVNSALQKGTRGLSGGSTLAKLLVENRGIRRTQYRPRLTKKQILAWADEHHQRHGRWPTCKSGFIDGQQETWAAIDNALGVGRRGLSGGSSVARVLASRRRR